MSFKLIGGGSSLETVVSDVNQNILELKGGEVTKVFKDDTGTRRVLLGKGADGFYGLKVSQGGTDVFTAADDELVFNSDNNVFKIVATGTVTIDEVSISSATASLVGTSVDVTHNLGYRPTVLAFTEVGSTSTPWVNGDQYLNSQTSGGALTEIVFSRRLITTTTTYVRFSLQLESATAGAPIGSSSIGPYDIRYYILQETAA